MTFSAKSADGRSQLWVRAMDALTAQPLAGTEEAIHPFWSPDSRSIAFFAGGKLKKIDAFGGPPVTLCDAPSGRGGSWNEAGVIVFAPTGTAAGLQRVSASGGVPAKLGLDVAGRWPWFLPGGRNFLYSAGSTVRLGSVDSGKTSLLIETLSDAVYAQGHVLYLREGTLMAQPFDLKRLALIGEAVPVAENVKSVGAQRRGIFSVSQNGMLVYQSGVSGGSHVLTWFDRAGKRLGALGGASDLLSVMLSPDGKRAASSVLDPTGHAFDLWLYDIARDLRTRFTFHASRSYLPAVWSPDGSSIAFATYRDGKSAVFRKATDLSGSEELLCDDPAMYPTSWSSDGKTILMVKTTGGNAADNGIFALHLSGDRKPVAIAPAAVAPDSPRFSPDGRWIAYGSIESQRAEIYVVPYSGLGGKLQISANGGTQARWRSDGKEIFYISPDGRLMAVQVKANTASLEVGRVQPLFANLPSRAGPNLYDVAPGGQRFLVDVQPERSVAEPLTLVQNWTAALKR